MVQIYKKTAKVRFFFRINKQFEEKNIKLEETMKSAGYFFLFYHYLS